jgi:hypothetical protein
MACCSGVRDLAAASDGMTGFIWAKAAPDRNTMVRSAVVVLIVRPGDSATHARPGRGHHAIGVATVVACGFASQTSATTWVIISSGT